MMRLQGGSTHVRGKVIERLYRDNINCIFTRCASIVINLFYVYIPKIDTRGLHHMGQFKIRSVMRCSSIWGISYANYVIIYNVKFVTLPKYASANNNGAYIKYVENKDVQDDKTQQAKKSFHGTE